MAELRTTADRVRAHRERLRQQGLRPIQLWVDDVRTPEFAARAADDALSVATTKHATDDQDFVDALSLDE